MVGYWWWCSAGGGGRDRQGGSRNSCRSAIVRCVMCGEVGGEGNGEGGCD